MSAPYSQATMDWDAYERSVLQRALALAGQCHPATNLYPYMELVKHADRLGCIVSRRSDQPDGDA